MLIVTILPVTVPQGVGNVASAAPAAAQDVPPDVSAFNSVWDRTDSLVASKEVARSWFWGPQVNWTTRELYLDDPTGTETRLVQYYDKSRMEANNPNGNKSDPFYVTNGLLTVELISGMMQTGNAAFEIG